MTFDLRWKVACGFSVTQGGFHPSVLTYWRRRIAASERPQRIFEAVSEVAATGVLAERKRRALDSTILDDAVARQDTVTQLIAQIRRVAAVVPAAAAVVAGLRGHDYAAGGKPDIAWDVPVARDLLVSALVNDALTVLDALAGIELDEGQSEAVAYPNARTPECRLSRHPHASALGWYRGRGCWTQSGRPETIVFGHPGTQC